MAKIPTTVDEMQYFDFYCEPGKEVNNRISISSGLPLISVITICNLNFDRENIIQMMNSLKNQTFPYWEWIIVINIEDPFFHEISSMDNRIKLIINDYESIAKAKIFAVNNSIADLIFNFDENNLLDKTIFECGFFTLMFNSEASFAYSNIVEFGSKGLLVNNNLNISEEKKNNIISSGAFIRKNKFLEVENYDKLSDNAPRAWYVWLDMLSRGSIPLKMGFYGFWHRNSIESLNIKENREKVLNLLGEKINNLDDQTEIIQFDDSYEVDYKNVPIKIDLRRDPIVPKDNKKRILFILPWSVVGGADIFNFNLIKGLKNKGYEISVITTQKCDYALRQGIEQYVEEYFDLTSFLKRKDWASFIEYIIRSRRINLVFLSNSYYGYYVLPWLKCQFKDIPFVDYIHAENWTLRNGGFPKDSNAIADYLDATYTCTSHLKDVMYEDMKRSVKNVKPVYIGTDPSFFDPNIEIEKVNELAEYYKGKKVILFPSRIVHYKRPLFAIKVIKKITEIRDDVRLAIVGDGVALEEVKRYIIDNNLQDIVTCFGLQQDVRPFYKIASATIICSLREGLTLTTYESLSMGVPIVSADIGGQSELIGEDCGELIKPYQTADEQFDFNYSDEEIQKYADALLRVLNKSETTNIKENCRKKIIKNFTIDKMVETLDKEFRKNIKSGSRVRKNLLSNIELAERYLLVHSVLESKDERKKY